MKKLLFYVLAISQFIAASQCIAQSDRVFVAFALTNGASALADGYLSHRYIKPENGCYEVNPLLGRYPSSQRTYAATLGTAAGVTLLSFLLKKHHRAWKYPFVIETGVHLVGIGMTLHNCSLR